MDIAQEKQLLRREAKQRAAVFWQKDRSAVSAQIAARCLCLPEYQRAKTVFCFVGIAGEADTLPLIAAMLADGRRVAVPLCHGGGRMEARLIRGEGDLTRRGAYGIPEPAEQCPLLAPSEIDLALVPCLCCDAAGHRLGHGAGYYDRYLAGAPFAWAVICPQALLLARVPADRFDLDARIIVTEQQTLRPGQTA